jgi:hypothetical protein
MAKSAATEQGLLTELFNEDKRLAEVAIEYSAARAKWEVASRRYAAVRDMVRSYVGQNPYSIAPVNFVGNDTNGRPKTFATGGRYRFMFMAVGDAIIAALTETKEPQSLDDLVARLREGGIGLSVAALTKSANAALMRKGGIEKTEDGKYFLKPEENGEPDDLPF